MKIKTKLFGALATLSLVLPLGLGMGKTVQAADNDDATVILHKVVYDKGTNPTTIPENQQNTGKEMKSFTGNPLAGVTFEVYDVSAEFYELRNADTGKDASQTQEQIKTIYSQLQPTDETLLPDGSKTTGADGSATFKLSKTSTDKDGNKVDAVYLFHESAAPKTVTTKSPDMVIGFPVYEQKDDGSYTENELNTIHLYPKNENDTPEITKTVDDSKENGFTVGMPINFSIKVRIPERIADRVKIEDGTEAYLYSSFYTEDTPSDNLKYKENKTVEGLFDKSGKKVVDVPFYTVSEGSNGFKLYYNDEGETTPNYESLKNYSGQELTFKFTMYLTDAAKPEIGENNTATLHYNNTPGDKDKTTPPSTVENITTYGKKLVKIDADSNQTLNGAEFVVENSEGNFLQKVTDGISPKWGDNDYSQETPQVKVFTSDIHGVIDISGLETGDDYTLVEVKTSDKGYVLPKEGIPFTVTKTSYNSTETLQKVPNKHKGTLPSTGGKGIYAFIAIGTIAVVGAVFYFTRGRKQTEA